MRVSMRVDVPGYIWGECKHSEGEAGEKGLWWVVHHEAAEIGARSATHF